jgi:hypothetical protein
MRTGISYTSAHGQNYLLELDGHFRPTGKIILRDYGDQAILKATNYPDYSFPWRLSFQIVPDLEVRFGLIRGYLPSWMTNYRYEEWKQAFFQAYEEELAKLGGFDVRALGHSYFRSLGKAGDDYAIKHYNFERGTEKHFEKIVRKISCVVQIEQNASDKDTCKTMFSDDPKVYNSIPSTEMTRPFSCIRGKIDASNLHQSVRMLLKDRYKKRRALGKQKGQNTEEILDYTAEDLWEQQLDLLSKREFCAPSSSITSLERQTRSFVFSLQKIEHLIFPQNPYSWGQTMGAKWNDYIDDQTQKKLREDFLFLQDRIRMQQEELVKKLEEFSGYTLQEKELLNLGKIKKLFCQISLKKKEKHRQLFKEQIEALIRRQSTDYEELEKLLTLRQIMEYGTHAQKLLAISLLKCSPSL